MILIIGGCGYIGSALYKYLSKSMLVESVDLEWFGNPGNIPNFKMNYRNLTPENLEKYSHIILLAGHSSVSMSVNDSHGAFFNNVARFENLLDKLGDQLLIYASSASVYSGVGNFPLSEGYYCTDVNNIYDFSKVSIDCLAALSKKRFISLRFGTVNGSSPNLRSDLMLNKMVRSAMNGKITVSNPQAYRAILSLTDLMRAVEMILATNIPSGVYNLANFNSTIGQIAQSVAQELRVPIDYVQGEPTYNFSISSSKIVKALDFRFNDSITDIIKNLVNYYETNDFMGNDRHAKPTI